MTEPQPRGKHDAATIPADDRPHSRACGIARHPHGADCHHNCPTCAGAATYLAGLQAQADELARLAENERFKIWEAGYLAALRDQPTNPYQWRGAPS